MQSFFGQLGSKKFQEPFFFLIYQLYRNYIDASIFNFIVKKQDTQLFTTIPLRYLFVMRFKLNNFASKDKYWLFEIDV